MSSRAESSKERRNDADDGPRNVLSDEQARLIDRYWRAANYLSVGQIYLLENALLKEPLTRAHFKPCLLGYDTRQRRQPLY